jgi:hypothetical protein
MSLMKYLFLILIFFFSSLVHSVDLPEEVKDKSFYINERHKYLCGLKENLSTIETRTCTYDTTSDPTTDELGADISKVLSHYKDESFRVQCHRKNKDEWDVVYYQDDLMAKYLPKDQECACAFARNSIKRTICDESNFKNTNDSKRKFLTPILIQLNKQFNVNALMSHLYSDGQKKCEVKPVEGCRLKLNFDQNITRPYIEGFENYMSSLEGSIQEKAWIETTVNEIRDTILKKGNITEALKEYQLDEKKLKRSCRGIGLNENKYAKAILATRTFFERICLNEDVNFVLASLEASAKDSDALKKPLDDYVKVDKKEILENHCEQINLTKKLICDVDTGKVPLIDLFAMNPEYVKASNIPIHPSLNLGIRCLGHKKDEIRYQSFPKSMDAVFQNFQMEMDRKSASNISQSFGTLVYDEDKVRTLDPGGNTDISLPEKIRRHGGDVKPKFVVKPPSKRDDKKLVPEIDYVPVTGDEATLHKPEIFRPSVVEITVEIPEKQALMSFGSVRKEVDLEKNSGTLTEEKKQEYREVEKQYEEILGRDLDIFSDNVDEIRNEIVVERGTKEYTRIANEASQLSTEVQALTKRAMTAGPRERFQIQGRLKKISNKLRSYKKFGYDFRVKVPTIEQILNVGRGDSHDQLSSFSAIESSHNSGGSYRPARDLKVSDYEPEDSGSNFPNFKLPAAGLGPAQDFTKNFTTGPTKLLPEKNYPVGAKKNNVAARGATKSSGASGVRRGPASRGGSSGGGISSGGSLGLSGGGASSPSAYSNTRTYQVENKSYEPQVLNNAEKPATKVVFVEDLKVMRVFKLNDEKVYEIDAEYTEDSFKENYSQFEEEVKLDGEQFFRYRVKDMERMLRENKL